MSTLLVFPGVRALKDIFGASCDLFPGVLALDWVGAVFPGVLHPFTPECSAPDDIFVLRFVLRLGLQTVCLKQSVIFTLR